MQSEVKATTTKKWNAVAFATTKSVSAGISSISISSSNDKSQN